MPATAKAFRLCLGEVEEKELSLKTYTAALEYIPAVFEHCKYSKHEFWSCPQKGVSYYLCLSIEN